MSLLTRKSPAPLAAITRFAGCSVNAMVNPAGTARGPRHTLSGGAPWIAATQACLIITVLVLVAGVMGWYRPAQGADERPAAQTLPPGAQPTLDEAAHIT